MKEYKYNEITHCFMSVTRHDERISARLDFDSYSYLMAYRGKNLSDKLRNLISDAEHGTVRKIGVPFSDDI